MAKDIFQLTVVSQNDRSCPVGSQLSVVVAPPTGGTLNEKSSPVSVSVPLPVSHAHDSHPPRPRPPTWFLVVGDDIGAARYTLTISGPGGENPTEITVHGADVKKWAAQNESHPTRQVYVKAACGIFGYAQSEHIPDGTQWIYTVTAGVDNPVGEHRG